MRIFFLSTRADFGLETPPRRLFQDTPGFETFISRAERGLGWEPFRRALQELNRNPFNLAVVQTRDEAMFRDGSGWGGGLAVPCSPPFSGRKKSGLSSCFPG